MRITRNKLIKFYEISALIIFNLVVLLSFSAGTYLLFLHLQAHGNNTASPVSPSLLNNCIYKEENYPHFTRKETDLLLAETWRQGALEYDSYTQFKERPYSGRYVNIDKNGFRYSKDQGPWPPDPGNTNIFIFGGGTVFGYGVPDEHTIASYLQAFLTKEKRQDICVYNFGRAFYFSTQERMLFEKLLILYPAPDIALFIDGMNEFSNSTGRPLFSDILYQHMNRKKIKLDDQETVTRELAHMILDAFPLIAYSPGPLADQHNISASLEKMLNSPAEEIGSTANERKKNASMVSRYIENKKLIEAAARAFGTKPVFVWQPVSIYGYDMKIDISCEKNIMAGHSAAVGYRQVKYLYEQKSFGVNFFWCADIQAKTDKQLYINCVNYSAEMSEILAKVIADSLMKNRFL